MTTGEATDSWRLPRIALLGYGRAGKDTAGEWLDAHTLLRYVGSTSQVVCPLIARELGISEEEAWATRHERRMFWYEWCNNYRRDDPTKLARVCLEKGDLVVGMRDIVELEACKAAHLFDQIVWIHRDVPRDPTVTFGPGDCDVVLYNDRDLAAFYRRLHRWVEFSHIPIRS